MVRPELNDVKQPKRISRIGRDARASHFLCCGPDLLTVRTDLNNALSVVESPRQIEVFDMHLRQNPCVIVKGKKEELEKLKSYLVTREKYAQPWASSSDR